MNQKVYHLRTNVKNNKPENSQIEIGEIALNYASDSEAIMFKNDADEIVEFKDSKYYEKLIEENELVTASGLNNLNDRVLVIENEVIENFNEKIENINNEIADLDYIREDISNSEEDITNIREEISDLGTIRENISKNAEDITDIKDTKADKEHTHEEFSNFYKLFIGTQEEYDAANSEGKITTGTIVIILDAVDEDGDETSTSVLGKAILGTLVLGKI